MHSLTFTIVILVWLSERQNSINWPYTETTCSVRVVRMRLGKAQQANEVWKQAPRLIVGGEIRGPPAVPNIASLIHRPRSSQD